MSRWSFVDGALLLDGRSPSAREVLDTLGTSEEPALRKAAHGIRFSDLALPPVLRISGAFPAKLSLETGVVSRRVFHPCDLTRGHGVVAGVWHAIEPAAAADLLDSLTLLGLELGPVPPASYFQLSAARRAGWQLLTELEIHNVGAWAEETDLPEPPGLAGTLYPYQRAGSNVLRVLRAGGVGALLADEMGLGKTIQAIGVLLDMEADSTSLVISPASLLLNWRRELEQFAPHLSVLVHAGAERHRVASAFDPYRVVLTSYELVAKDFSFLQDASWSLVIADEAQLIKNPESERSRLVKQLPRQTSIAVTGTPVENSLRDLWSLSEFIAPQLLGGLPQFQRDFPDERAAAERLGHIVGPVTIRRRASEVLDQLPPRVDIPVALSPSESLLSKLRSVSGTSAALAANTAMRIICAHADPDRRSLVEMGGEAKLAYLAEALGEVVALREKALVFASYVHSIDLLVSFIKHHFPHVLVEAVDGRTPPGSRLAVIDRFTDSQTPGVLVMNPAAAGVGLNITAASHVFHFNPLYNPASTAQATARAHRNKQTRTVFVHHMFYSDTVEERAVTIAAGKIDLAEGVDATVNGGDADE